MIHGKTGRYVSPCTHEKKLGPAVYLYSEQSVVLWMLLSEALEIIVPMLFLSRSTIPNDNSFIAWRSIENDT